MLVQGGLLYLPLLLQPVVVPLLLLLVLVDPLPLYPPLLLLQRTLL